MSEHLDWVIAILWLFLGLITIVGIFYNYSYFKKKQKEFKSGEAINGKKMKFWFEQSEKNLRLYYLLGFIEVIIGVIVLIAIYFWQKNLLNL